jgi:periplasmic copper chaperone A
MTRLLRHTRHATVLLIAVAATMAIAPAASAHVSVSSPDASPGGFGKLVFLVPTESETASTVKLTVTLPADTPFAEVSAKSLPGWSIATTAKHLAKPITTDEGFTLTKAVSTVTWTAGKDQGIAPGQFNEFELSVGPFPKGTDAITLPTRQTYSDGSVVTWDQPTPASGKEPEHPVPTLKLESSPAAPGHNPVTPVAEHSSAVGSGETDGLARGLGSAGLALGAVALLIAVRSTRRRAA